MSSKARKTQTINTIAFKGNITLTKTNVGLSEVPNVDATNVDNHVDGTTNKVFTATEQTKLTGIEAGAQVNVQPNWTEGDSGADSYVLNKPNMTGLNRSDAVTYISGTGTAGADNTAQTVKSVTLPGNTLTQVGDRLRVRCYFQATGGAPCVGATLINAVLVSDVDVATTNFAITEAWVHYIDNTHANIIHMHNGALGSETAANVAGFDWDSDQAIIFTQDAVPAQHLVLFALIVDIFPKRT